MFIPSSSGASAPARKLPSIRKNLEFHRGNPTLDGVPTWTIVDPIRSRYYQIEWPVYQMIQRWEAGTIERLHAAMARETTCVTTLEDIEDLVKFLYANNLTEQSAGGTYAEYQSQAEAGHQSYLTWLIHHYLFIRIPLVHPDGFLKATLPLVAPLYCAAAGWAIGTMGLIGLVMASRQWDSFLATFLYFFNWRGAILYSLSLGAVKVVHELGHAYTATRFGCRVPTIGVAFMVMMPVLYSDVSDSYRLASKRKRLLIAAGGVIAELGLAAIALTAWGVLPDGTARSVAFIVATTSLIMSLAVNLNPLMRFDGYYLLADGLGIPNLQDRAFAFGQWKLRSLLFGRHHAQPEAVSTWLGRTLVAYAWATWLYRLALFTGIAVTVYHYFFKALGIILFLVEIVWFIAMPIVRELTGWWKNRALYASSPRAWITACTFSAILSLAFVPWHTRVAIPAVLQSSSYATIYSPTAGRIRQTMVQNGQPVRAGQTLVELENPWLAKESHLAEIKTAMWNFRLNRQAGHEEDRQQRLAIAESLSAALAELDGVQEQRDDLVLKAPFDGIVRDHEDSLHPGRWISAAVPVLYMISPVQPELTAFVPVDELAYVNPGQTARFVPSDLTRPSLTALVDEIAEVDERDFSVPYLASIYGGDVPVRKDTKGRLKADISVYRVRLRVTDSSPLADQAVAGLVQIEGESSSLARRVWDHLVAVLIRESGF